MFFATIFSSEKKKEIIKKGQKWILQVKYLRQYLAHCQASVQYYNYEALIHNSVIPHKHKIHANMLTFLDNSSIVPLLKRGQTSIEHIFPYILRAWVWNSD